MFEVIFGTIWTVFMAFFTFIFYSANTGTISVNGQIVSQEEFNLMIGPKIFIGIFWIIGLMVLFRGLKKVITNYKTEKYGEVCYGRIIDIFRSGAYVNNVPELKASISVYIESTGTMEEVSEVIGLATKRKYKIGDYVEGKYYNGDINITSYIPEAMIPSHIKSRFSTVNVNINGNDSIFIDGVEYIKKDSIGKNSF